MTVTDISPKPPAHIDAVLIQRDHRAAKYLEFVAGAKLDEAYNDFRMLGESDERRVR